MERPAWETCASLARDRYKAFRHSAERVCSGDLGLRRCFSEGKVEAASSESGGGKDGDEGVAPI